MRDTRESPNAATGPNALFSGQDLVEVSRVYLNNVGFVLCIRKTSLHRL